MILPDANVLVYALNPSAEHHATSRAWLARVLSGVEPVIFPWVVLVAVLRLLTLPRIAAVPRDPSEVVAVVEGWLARSNARIAEPDAQHLERLRGLLVGASGVRGNLMNDAHLAALAIQYRATIVTFDRDFARFPGVKFELPAA